ncbi:MAG: SDR family NAD(P)-dependent oxidoreductase [Hyphomicrobiales bacterium]
MNDYSTPLFGFDAPFSAMVFGTSGGIGSAISQRIHKGMTLANANLSDTSPTATSRMRYGVHQESIDPANDAAIIADQASANAVVDSGQSFVLSVNKEQTRDASSQISQSLHHLFAINRSSKPESHSTVTGLQADALDESQLVATKEAVQNSISEQQFAPLRLIVVGIGTLHQTGPDGTATIRPEKTWRDLSADTMAKVFAANTIAPALIAKHFLPLLPRSGRSVFAVLSARVGSISDNRLGGWYSYRASKAALNQIIKTTSIELARTRPDAICIGLHPGTVDTGLSKPFQANVAEGKLFTPQTSANYLLNVISTATTSQSGSLLAWDGSVVPT